MRNTRRVYINMDWSALGSAFGLVFLAELGDKTQLAVMTQTCRYRCGWPVFLGASLALTLVTALGAAAGQLVARLVPPLFVRLAAAGAFFIMGVLLWREAAQRGRAEEAEDRTNAWTPVKNGSWRWKAFSTTFALLFVAELGDKTQLAVLSLTAQRSAAWLIFLGGALALICVTALGVLCGQQISRFLPEKWLLRLSASAFLVMGALMGLGVL